MPPGRGAAGHSDHQRNALDVLFRRYSPILQRFFARRATHKSDVADLVQDVFLRLSKIEGVAHIEKAEHYIFATAASALRDRARRDAVRARNHHDPFDEIAHGGSDFSAERVLEGREALQRLQQALRELPERTRDVFVLRIYEDLKMADIARAIGISQRACEKHYAKAMAFVAEALKDYRNA